ncbi:MAG TPA: NAD-dependent epimerase/dehydratase family protein [Gemmataceae bacterium]|jgi:nucleoside-diphosphate-sugar epimerase
MNALVTGGGGFLGSAIVRRLRERGDRVHSFSRNRYPELDSLGVTQHQGDIADSIAVSRAAAGCDIVFHVAAKAGVGGRYRDYFRANVIGTANVLRACRHHGIPRLVYTSSPSVVFDGGDMAGVSESVPYPSHYDAAYPQTKAIAERTVLRASDATLATVALRPHLIWGPGDNHLIPRILARARAGRLRRVGTESKLIDSLYIDNAGDAHLLAADRLMPGSPIAGKAYFITQGEPVPLWDLVNRILHAAGLGSVTRSIPPRLAYGAGWLLEVLYAIFRPQEEPPVTRFVARELTTAHWFDISAARRDLGYEPKISLDEGLHRLAVSFRHGG